MRLLSYYKAAFILLTIIPLALGVVMSCSSAPKKVALTDETVAHWNATVEKIIKEPERAAKLKALGRQLIDVSKAIQHDVEALNQKAMTLNENYDATQEDFQQLVGEFVQNRHPKFLINQDIHLWVLMASVDPVSF